MFDNMFSGSAVDVSPHGYEIRHYRQDVIEIVATFKEEFKKLQNVSLDDEGEGLAGDKEDSMTPQKRLSAQRSQALGAASKRLSRGVALRFILDCKRAGFPMSVHLATRLLGDLFAGYPGRSSVSESTLVEFAGGGPKARRNAKLDLDDIRRQVIDRGLVRKHRRLLKAAKSEAEAIRAAAKRG